MTEQMSEGTKTTLGCFAFEALFWILVALLSCLGLWLYNHG